MERMETRSIKKIRDAEVSRIRYQVLNEEDKKELNRKRALEQKRLRQRVREMAELESLLRQTNDICDAPEIVRQQSMAKGRARNVKTEKANCQTMSAEEYQEYKYKPRTSIDENIGDPEVERQYRINYKKALRARERYHRMSDEEKRMHNRRRSETLRRRRQEEAALLATPIREITAEVLEKVQKVIFRNARRAESARLRYQRMTPDERRQYNTRCKEYNKTKQLKKELPE